MRNLNRRSRLRTGSGRQQRSLAGKDASMDEKGGNSPAMAALACQGRGEGKDVSHLQIALVGVNEYCLDTSLLSKHHSLTVEEMVIFPMPTKMGMEPSSPR